MNEIADGDGEVSDNGLAPAGEDTIVHLAGESGAVERLDGQRTHEHHQGADGRVRSRGFRVSL